MMINVTAFTWMSSKIVLPLGFSPKQVVDEVDCREVTSHEYGDEDEMMSECMKSEWG